MTEINDYAPALLKIKAAIKSLERDLPANNDAAAWDAVNIGVEAFTNLRGVVLLRHQKRINDEAAAKMTEAA